MKKISFIPIALISLTPTISMVGCNKPGPEPAHKIIDVELTNVETHSFYGTQYLISKPISANQGDILNVTAKFDEWDTTANKKPKWICLADQPYSELSTTTAIAGVSDFYIGEDLLTENQDYILERHDSDNKIHKITLNCWDNLTNRTFDKNIDWKLYIMLDQDMTNKYLFILGEIE